jgi:hypothetical protein
MRKKIFSLSATVAIIASLILSIPVQAATLVVAKQDDIYGYLQEAAKINVLTNNVKKCLKAGSTYNYVNYDSSALSGSNASAGKIFYKPGGTGITNTDHSTSLWLEDAVQGNGGDDGAIWCWQGQSDNKGLFQLWLKATGLSAAQALCKEGYGRIIQRAKYEYSYDYGYYTYADDVNCSSFNDSGAYYILKSNWEDGFKEAYNLFRSNSQNKYLPTYDQIGNYNNVDGYFNYILDFNLKCSADVYDSQPSGTTVYPITTFDRSTNKIVAKTKYIHVSNNKSWDYSLGSNTANSCTSLLTRIEELRTQNNGIGDDRVNGYEGIILAKLQDECNNLKSTETGENAWEELKKKLNEILASDTASQEQKDKAQDSLNKINAANGNYMVSSGSETDAGGKVYECLNIDELKVDFDEYKPPIDEITDPPSGTTEASCYDNAQSLGWILCPIIDQLADAIQGIYEKYITPFLVLDSELFDNTGGKVSGTYEAWKQFRDMGNLAFIILFIIVIFSQLTGVGIDNYGIKKALPKLIIGAILINMSYIICQLCIDVANIVGYSIGGLFENIAKIDTSGLSLAETGGQGHTLGAVVILGALVVLLAAGAYLAIGPTVLIPVFMALLSVFIAILFCFILLAVRKAFAVLLVAVSPLAFACYMLPNTKPIYDKWFNAFKGVLLAFPICSAMIYGGQMVARIIVAASGGSNMPSTIALSAAVISIVPIFMIPKAISGSMAAISGGIVGLQNRLTGRARGGIARSGFAQDMQRRTMMQKSGFKYDKDGNVIGQSVRGKIQDKMALTKGSQRRLAMRRAGAARAATMEGDVTQRWGGAKGAEQAALMGQAAAAQRDAQEVSDIESTISRSGEIDDNAALQNGLRDAMVSGDTKRMMAYQNILYGKGEDGRDTARKAVEEAQATGKVSSDTIKAYGSNAMNKWARDLKANARSDFEFVKQAAATGSGAGDIGGYRAIDKAQKYTAENMATMDDSQIKSMIASMGDASVSQEQKDHAARAAYEALHNDNISLKGERRTDLETLAAGYTPSADASAGGGEEGGGTPAPAPAPEAGGGPISPAMLTDDDIAYHNKLKEMAGRDGGSPDELHIDHSTPPAGGGASGGSAPKPSTPSPTGTNSGTGKPRAKEGNKFDYYPRQKGESSTAYGQRLNRQKLIEQKYQSDPPKAGESHADWMKRVGIPPSGTSA